MGCGNVTAAGNGIMKTTSNLGRCIKWEKSIRHRMLQEELCWKKAVVNG